MELEEKQKINEEKPKQNLKSFLNLGLSWIFGILTLVIALESLVGESASFLVALPMLLISLLLLPPAKEFIKLPPKIKTISIIALFIVFTMVSSQNEERQAKQRAIKDFYKNSAQIFAEIQGKIDAKEYQEALSLISKYSAIVEKDKTLLLLQKKAQTRKLLEEAKNIPAMDYKKNMELYQKLVELDPEESIYSKKLKFYTEKAERQEKIESQFSAWDGSHRKLTQYIKNYMHDPKSYEHIKTVYRDMGDYLIVETTFRGKNRFGAFVLNTAMANITLDGQILAVEFDN